MTKLKIAALLVAVGIGAAAVGIFRQPATALSPADDQPQVSQRVIAPDGRTELAEQRVVEGIIQKVDPAQRTVTLQVNALFASNNTWTNSNGSWTNVNNQWQDFALPQVSQFAPLTLRQVDAAQQTITVIPDQSTTWANSPVQWQNWVIPSVYAQSNLVGSNLIYNQPANYGMQLSFQEVKHKLTPHAKIIIDGKEARLVDLKPNTPVQLTLNKQGLVTRIEANGGTMQQCFVRSFDFTKHLITVRHFTNNVYQYELAPDARVEIDGRDSALTELKADMAVTLRFSAVKPKEVIALSTKGPEISVVLKSVNASGRTITMRLPKEHLTAADVPVAEDARILINGKEARLADLKPGIKLVLHMAADPEKSLVMEIRAGKGK